MMLAGCCVIAGMQTFTVADDVLNVHPPFWICTQYCVVTDGVALYDDWLAVPPAACDVLPLLMVLPCGCAVMEGAPQTFTTIATLSLYVPQLPVTRTQ